MHDAIDRQIIAILSKEARIPIKTLAARINLSRSATSERITRLENNGPFEVIGQISEVLIPLTSRPSCSSACHAHPCSTSSTLWQHFQRSNG